MTTERYSNFGLARGKQSPPNFWDEDGRKEFPVVPGASCARTAITGIPLITPARNQARAARPMVTRHVSAAG